MKADGFTKIVLSVIAINLTILTFKSVDIFPKAYGNNDALNIETGAEIKYGLVPLNENGSIDINIKSISNGSVMDINLAEINGHSWFYDSKTEHPGKYCRIPVYNYNY